MERWNDLGIKTKGAYISAVISFVIGWTLIVWGFIIEPTGEVHSSIQWVLGQALVYCASVFGLTGYVQDVISDKLKNKDND